jgi:hypothetical protein
MSPAKITIPDGGSVVYLPVNNNLHQVPDLIRLPPEDR